MRVTKGYWAFAAIAAATMLAGCNGNNKPAGTSGETTTTGSATTGTTNPPPVTVDDKLKHDAYSYLGFDRKGDSTFEYSKVQGAAGERGTEAIEIISSTPEKSVVKINRGGALTELGAETYEVRPDGIYLIEINLGKLEKPMLAMPSNVKVGDKWLSELVVNTPAGKKLSFKINNNATKEEEVITKAGEFNALLVTGTGTITADGKASTVQYKTWYVKDLGNVMMRIESKDSEGTPIKQSVELVTKAG